MLRSGGLCVCQVTAVLHLAASTASAHLAELRRAGLVVEEKQGRWVRYSLATDPEARAILAQVWSLIAGDPQLQADAQLVLGLRGVPVEDLCRVDLDLARLGLKRRAPLAAGRETS
jgi:DNA-binding transcriptional ArsR family regulator